MQLTQEKLKYLLHYNLETGDWVWLNPPNHNTRLLGQLAGNRRSDGYLLIRIRGRLYYSGRLAWFYMTERWPEEIDHKDRDPSNDRWVNLREATSSQNKYNQNRVGIVGVYRSGNSNWMAMAGNTYLGVYTSIEDAIDARKAALVNMGHSDFAELNEGT
jgi:hypothetical protein